MWAIAVGELFLHPRSVCQADRLPFARSYMLTAETIEAGRAKEIGLLQEVVETTEELNKWEATLKSQLGKVRPKVNYLRWTLGQEAGTQIWDTLVFEQLAPGAVSNTKSLIRAVDKPIDDGERHLPAAPEKCSCSPLSDFSPSPLSSSSAFTRDGCTAGQAARWRRMPEGPGGVLQ